MQVVIVESPSKAKTINKYLGNDYKVLASYGHIRDLPSRDGSVDPEQDFAMIWDMDAKSKKRVSEIVDAVKKADGLILATDPDREGEAISWHLMEVLHARKALNGMPVRRVAFNAITKKAVTEAMANPRDVDQALVDAYLARRALDYLVGFTLSPVLWRKLPGSRSAGRVQSVALRLICEREMEIEKFVAEEYWSLDAQVTSGGSAPFTARLVTLDGEKLTKFSLGNAGDAARAKAAVEGSRFRIADVQSKPVRRNPYAPFTTSTLQQEASRKLGFNASRTMRTAQRLYEGISIGGETVGLITYMRTDGIDMAPEAVQDARAAVKGTFGAEYLPDSPRMYKSKAKNAQEAHECIRPTSFTRHPRGLKNLGTDEYRLYDLIWKRAIASQMEAARLEQTTIEIASSDDKTGLRATGSVIVFDGFLKLYTETRDDSESEEDGESRLPKVTAGADADVLDPNTEQHFTQPPPRFTEASLVKRLEELGIGRPSTYASIISVLQDRTYVTMDKNRFIPDDKGRIVTAFLENFFARYVQYDFTANLEETLDEISDGKADWKQFLRDFWREFNATVQSLSELRITHVLDALNEALGPHIFPPREDGKPARLCPTCNEGELSLKIGRFGAFIGCSNYPDCNYTRQLAKSEADDPELAEGKVLGVDPNTSLEVSLRTGRFGPYVQLGEENKELKEKPKRASIPKGWEVAEIDFDKAMMLLSLPREVGPHPEDGEMIEAAIGRYGPYIKHGKTYANLPTADEVFEIGLNRAVTVIAEKLANPRGRGQTAAKPIRELGAHPETEDPVNVFEGRYGPYVKHQKINATIPKGMDPQKITLEEAVALIAEREAKGGTKKKATKKAATKTTKKTTTKKAAKKSTKKATKKAAKKST
ncbi:type I DNA topoisomerase [Aquisalinus flavus]|uniref:DNA topoisomerase 1 n=1 Tax=Aquisalinus flavus TaxID=1526572 RepID=A0A8J2V5R4_9PROT|nr:type I DNA topoisomerase [Aquisalinus flavus]MBD0427955.1 type I DNA topoisomerase [Aquisalinus flavus]UNE47710.1 type I DNA topoisomerase [Aquisalinus flavus]GGD05256.1 DNA topoisomerase 1 [Aquisalinus flavus]